MISFHFIRPQRTMLDSRRALFPWSSCDRAAHQTAHVVGSDRSAQWAQNKYVHGPEKYTSMHYSTRRDIKQYSLYA